MQTLTMLYRWCFLYGQYSSILLFYIYCCEAMNDLCFTLVGDTFGTYVVWCVECSEQGMIRKLYFVTNISGACADSIAWYRAPLSVWCSRCVCKLQTFVTPGLGGVSTLLLHGKQSTEERYFLFNTGGQLVLSFLNSVVILLNMDSSTLYFLNRLNG